MEVQGPKDMGEAKGFVTLGEMARVVQHLNSFPDPNRRNRAERRRNVKGKAIRKSASSRRVYRGDE